MQEGGENTQPQEASLAQQIGSLMQTGVPPKVIVQQLISNGVDEFDIRDAFMDLGISSSELDELFKSNDELEEELTEQLEAASEDAEERGSGSDEDYDDMSDSDVQFGAFGADLPEAQTGFESAFPSTVNQFFGIRRPKGDSYVRNPMMDYLPMDLGTRGDVAGAAFFLAEAATDLFSGRKDPNTGLKEGFYRDVKAKKARAKEAIPGYYDYKVTTAAGDKNTYVGDPRDLYNAAKNQGQLRTEQQYKEDVNRFSQFDFDKDKNQYVGQFSSRKIDPGSSIYSKNQKKDLEKFLQNSTSLGDLESRFDPETLNMLIGSQKEGMGLLGISPSGVASSYIDAASNPYLYETMMGLNTLKSTAPKAPNLGAQPTLQLPTYNWANSTNSQSPIVNSVGPVNEPPKSITFQEFVLQDPVRRLGADAQQLYANYLIQQNNKQYGGQTDYALPFLAYGGDLVLAQVGTEKQLLSYDEWLGATGRGMMGQELQDFKDYQAYVSSFKTDAPSTTSPTVPNTTAPTTTQPAAPQVEMTNRIAGDLNRLIDSRFTQGYGKLSNLAVLGAGFTNEMFQNQKAKEAEGRLYEMTQADNMFGYFEDPVNKQGTWDVNTGLAEQDNRVTYMRQFGGEMMDEEITEELDLDPDTIAQLIAAGANIQIL